MKPRALYTLLLLVLFSFACDSVTDPEEEEGGSSGGSGGGGGSYTNRYVTLLDATIHVNNTFTSGPVGGAEVVIDRGSSFCESGYTNSSGIAEIYEDISVKIETGVTGLGMDIIVSAPGFNTVTIEDYIVYLTLIESGDGWAHYALSFSHTVNLTPEAD